MFFTQSTWPVLVETQVKFCHSHTHSVQLTVSDKWLTISDNWLTISDNQLTISDNQLTISDNQLTISDNRGPRNPSFCNDDAVSLYRKSDVMQKT